MRNIPRQPPLAPAPWIHSGAAILQVICKAVVSSLLALCLFPLVHAPVRPFGVVALSGPAHWSHSPAPSLSRLVRCSSSKVHLSISFRVRCALSCSDSRRPCPPYQRRAFRSNSVHRAQKKPWYYEMNVIFSKEAREERARKIKEESTKGRFAGQTHSEHRIMHIVWRL